MGPGNLHFCRTLMHRHSVGRKNAKLQLKPFGVADMGWGLVGHARLSETNAWNCFRGLHTQVRFHDPLYPVKGCTLVNIFLLLAGHTVL